MKKGIIIGVIVIVLLAIGTYIIVTGQQTNKTTQTQNSSSTSSKNVAATITYSDSGFSPSKITVKAGDTIAVKNSSSTDVNFDSDPHPIHTDDTDLNAGLINPGQTKTFVVDKKGTFGYHNHLNPSQTGSIVIQ